MKDERISKVFKLRYFSGEKKLTWQKVARKLNVSTQTAINLHEKGRLILRNKLESKEISDYLKENGKNYIDDQCIMVVAK